MTRPHERKLAHLVGSIRQDYINQFQKFISDCSANKEGQPEIKLQLNGESGLHRDLYCADYITAGDNPEITELQPAHQTEFDQLVTLFEGISVTFKSMRWDFVVITVYGAVIHPSLFNMWFEKWFDPEGQHQEPNVELSGTIHSLSLDEFTVSLDLGTAPVEALWEFLDTLKKAGITSLFVDNRPQNN
jgi:hypothetical protein